MKKSLFALGFGISIILVGCGEQPNIDISDENQTDQNRSVVEVNNTIEPTNQPVVIVNTRPKEQNLSTTSVSVTNNDLIDTDVVDTNETNKVQNLSAILSKKAIYFDFDKFEIKDDMINELSQIANIIKDNKKTFTVRIEGNCDEWGTDEYNYALGLKRAKAVKDYLAGLGVDKSKLTIISYGESNPVCTAHTKECWAKNRRVNFTILP